MVNFIFKTLTTSSTTYKGPSGRTYVIYKDQPFKVEDELDIAFFKINSRFEVKGIVSSIKKAVKKKKEVVKDDDLETWLTDIKGIGKKVADILIDTYGTKNKLFEVLENGGQLHEDVTVLQQGKILNKYLEEMN